jgi:signal transduction histidine kinase
MAVATQAPGSAVLAGGRRRRSEKNEATEGPSASDAGTPWRVLLLGRDAGRVSGELALQGIAGCPCEGVRTLRREMARGAGALVLTGLTAEGLSTSWARSLRRVLARQPGWSDLPVVAFLSGDEPAPVRDAWLAALDVRGRVVLLDGPIRTGPLVTAVRSALQARRRQYEARTASHELAQLRAERRATLARERDALARADAAMRTKEDFLSTLSHELRTPINAILGWTSMLLDGSLSPERARRALQIIDRNARAQGRLVQELIDASEIGGGRVRLRARAVDFAAIVRFALETAAPAADAKEITVACDIAPAILMRGDPDRLLQVASQLVANAVKFTPRGGAVHVRLVESDRGATLTVVDTGQGIAPDSLPFVFDRFWQADGSTTRRFGGLGLGLAIVRRLVELHGGTAEVRCDGGSGATFVVTLPIVAGGSGEVERLRAAASTSEDTGADKPFESARRVRSAPPSA